MKVKPRKVRFKIFIKLKHNWDGNSRKGFHGSTSMSRTGNLFFPFEVTTITKKSQ